MWFNLLALAQLVAGETETALRTTLRALRVRPYWRPIMETLVCCYGLLERWDDARRASREMTRLPIPTGDALAPFRDGHPIWRDRMQELLQRAAEDAVPLERGDASK